MTLLKILLVFTIVWFFVSFVIIEGSDPFHPTPINRFAKVVKITLKVLLFLAIFLGVTGFVDDVERKYKL